jgi:apolipoprotein N-acyltransferase
MRRILPDRTVWAGLASGLLLAAAFPLADLGFLAWFALVPLLLVAGRHPFKSGFSAGLAFFAAVLYWLNIVMVTYGGLPLVLSVVLYLLLSAYLALFWGTATWAACRLREMRGYPLALTLPVFWVGLEFARAFLLTGFPWATLGYSQHAWPAMIQSADLFGVYGLSYLILLVNAAIAGVLARRRTGIAGGSLRSLLFAAILLTLNLGYGYWQLGRVPEQREEQLRVTLVQGNIAQELKWRPDNQRPTVELYRVLTLQANRQAAADLVIWPEAAMPFYYQDGGALAEDVARLPRQTGAALLFGSPAYERDGADWRYRNSAFLLDADAQLAGRSDKVHLVPFGEYVPLGRFLPFINKLVTGVGDYSPGELKVLPLRKQSLGVLICYEAIFPELAREQVRLGGGLLVNITNDAWFGRSSAPWQHLAMASFRAIENRVWMVRAANTGISAFISPAGRVVERSGLFERATLTASVGLGARPGLYAAMGDLIPGIFLLVGLAWLLQTRRSFPQGAR